MAVLPAITLLSRRSRSKFPPRSLESNRCRATRPEPSLANGGRDAGLSADGTAGMRLHLTRLFKRERMSG